MNILSNTVTATETTRWW